MRIIKPHRITDALLVSSTVPEPDVGDGTLWNATTAYAADAQVYLGHRRYRAASANTGKNPTAPPAGEAPAVWVDMGPTNRWAMFDDVIGTISTGASPLTVVLAPGSTSGLPLLELQSVSTARVTMRDGPGGVVVYSREIELDGSEINDIYDWLTAPPELRADLVLTDLPDSYTECQITLELIGSGTVGVGVYKPGQAISIGATQYGASVGIIDYSRKERDAFGRTTIVERAYSKRASFEIMTEKADFNRIFRTLASLRATPSVYIGTDGDGYEPLIVYGFYRDFSIDVAYPTLHLCSLQVEGLV